MITSEQIKAARALLNWKQSDLAAAANISLPSINNIERNAASPRQDTWVAIKRALEDAGIEFIGQQGVTLKEEIFEFLNFEGPDFLSKLYDDIFFCLRGPDDRADMCGIDERKFFKYGGQNILRYFEYQQRVQFKERILIKENDNFILAPPETYRWISAELIGTIPYIVYKDRFAMIMWESSRAIITKNQAIADTFRTQFEFLWALGKPLPEGIENQLLDPEMVRKLNL